MKPLADELRVSHERRARLEKVIATTRRNPPATIADIVRDELGVDLTTRYAGMAIPHPFGKGSGQLSCTMPQIVDDAKSGLAFVVLKTVIAEDSAGARSMADWAVRETRMTVEQRASLRGRQGWTVTWTGRGWPGTLDEYLAFLGESLTVGAREGLLVVPSVKYHLPVVGATYRVSEYRHTTARICDTWRQTTHGVPILEKDFSPTLAGDARASGKDMILDWLVTVPGLIGEAAAGNIALGVKVMNALFDDEFQLEMIRVLADALQPLGENAFLVVFNRMFDMTRKVAYGGWDLSERNLRVLDAAQAASVRLPPLSATGNICSGKMMIEYARRGCENGQVHTFFQLPRSVYTAHGASRTLCALYTLLLHPEDGLVPWLWHVNEQGLLDEVRGMIRFRDLVRHGR